MILSSPTPSTEWEAGLRELCTADCPLIGRGQSRQSEEQCLT